VRHDERGSGSVLMVAVMVVVLALSGAAILIAGYLVAAHRAKSVADLAALSGATAVLEGGDGCATAGSVATRSGVSVSSCQQIGDQIDFVVTVTATVTVPVSLPRLPRQVSAVGHAGPTGVG
jgi:secretion/DNA translocation related TadE-like protein